MQALREYLTEMPMLSSVLLECLGENMEQATFDYNNAEEMRLAYKEAQQIALERLVDKQIPYFALTYPQVMYKCFQCNEEIKGAYYEVTNPLTMTRIQFRVRLMHEIITHGHFLYSEPIVNMSETLMGTDEHVMDFKKLAKVLDGLPLPPAVAADLEAGLAAMKVNA